MIAKRCKLIDDCITPAHTSWKMEGMEQRQGFEIYLFIHQLCGYLLSIYYVPGTMIGAGLQQ